jgi:hypothetical protein
MTKPPFWDLDESAGFVSVVAKDGLTYKVLDKGTKQDQQDAADVLARVRKDINTLLIYMYRNPDLWYSKPIAWGVFHTFDIHVPCWNQNINSSDEINRYSLQMGKLFNYQETPINEYGIIGLNKPKKIISMDIEYNGKQIEYELAEKRSIFLTIRDKRNWKVLDYPQILDLALHELTHTTCNDVRWKEDNHLPPYYSYNRLIKKFARDCGVLS